MKRANLILGINTKKMKNKIASIVTLLFKFLGATMHQHTQNGEYIHRTLYVVLVTELQKDCNSTGEKKKNKKEETQGIKK